MTRWHSCSAYCAGEVHAIPVLSDPSWDQAEVLASMVHQHAQTHPDERIIDLLPAREAETVQWASLPGWHDGYGDPSQPTAAHRPWLALVGIPSLPLAPPRCSDARKGRHGD